MMHIFDADSLWHLMNTKKIENIDFENSQFIFTPNKVEFSRLFDKFLKENKDFSDSFEKDFDYDQEQYNFFDYLLNTKKSNFNLKIIDAYFTFRFKRRRKLNAK